jgi:hypothetical protein
MRQETEKKDERQETKNKRWEMGDGRRETGVRRWEMEDGKLKRGKGTGK